MKRFIYLFSAVLLLWTACQKPDPVPVPKPVPVVEEPELYELKDLASMTLHEKIGQLFCIAPESVTDATGYVTAGYPEFRERFEKYPCGGFILLAGNIKNPSQIQQFNRYLHELGSYPFICVDEEGGSVARIANNSNFSVIKYSSMGAVGATGDKRNAFNAGSTIGSYLYRYRFDVDLAPVADVNTNPENVVIGNRSFGSDPGLVADMVGEFLNGLQDSKVEGCLKHFPGHGDTKADSHYGYAETLKTWEEIAACEMVPFRKGIEEGARLIMTAHVSAPNVTGSSVPSTLSPLMLTEKLRGELGYKGLIITDALGMGAITQEYGPGDAAIQAILAGVDILLTPENYEAAYDNVEAAVKAGTIPVSRIEESAARVLALKKDILDSRDMLAK